MIGKLRAAGMNIVRMNFSHGSYEVYNEQDCNVLT
jgi:pyruvate kinase